MSRHERLFWFGKIGVYVWKDSIISCYIILIVWLATMIQSNGFDHFELFNKNGFNIIVMIITVMIALAVLLLYLPTVIFQYTLTTSIQMMKRRDYIELVIKEQKHQKDLRSVRMYQSFKLIRRELVEYFHEEIYDKNLKRDNLKILKENFRMFAQDGNGEILISNLIQFAAVSGANLKKLESYVLMKKANCDGNTISRQQLFSAIKQTTNDVKIDPYDVIKTIFILLMNVKDKISVDELQSFFEEYQGYFEQTDVEEFMDEVLSLQRGGGRIDIQEIASLIRDDIE